MVVQPWRRGQPNGMPSRKRFCELLLPPLAFPDDRFRIVQRNNYIALQNDDKRRRMP
jgi:hypothetical protein